MSYILAGNSNCFINYFPAINLKKIKDDYSGKFAEIFKNLQSRVSCFYEYEMLPDFSFSTEINQL
jgi:hypothetical protein